MTTVQWAGVAVLVVGLWMAITPLLSAAVAALASKIAPPPPTPVVTPTAIALPTPESDVEAFRHLSALKSYFSAANNSKAVEIVRLLLPHLLGESK